MGIPEPQCLDAARLHKLFPLRVMFALVGKAMLATVQFHIQLRFFAKEIQIVTANGMLAAEFVTIESPTSQPGPNRFFRPCFIFAKLAGAFAVGHGVNLGNHGKPEKLVFSSPSS